VSCLHRDGHWFESSIAYQAEVVELVYTTDLKSVEHSSCGFEPRLRHHLQLYNTMYKPLPPDITIKDSLIEGLGLFAIEFIPAYTNLGISHYFLEGKLVRTPLGGFYNHSSNPNCYTKYVYPPGKVTRVCLVTLRDIEVGEELTAFYKIQPLSTHSSTG
jgi:SET domain-containing protein